MGGKGRERLKTVESWLGGGCSFAAASVGGSGVGGRASVGINGAADERPWLAVRMCADNSIDRSRTAAYTRRHGLPLPGARRDSSRDPFPDHVTVPQPPPRRRRLCTPRRVVDPPTGVSAAAPGGLDSPPRPPSTPTPQPLLSLIICGRLPGDAGVAGSPCAPPPHRLSVWIFSCIYILSLFFSPRYNNATASIGTFTIFVTISTTLI